MASFLFALNAVSPIVITVAIGYVLKCIGLITPDLAKATNKLVFKLFLPAMLFLNVYKIEDFGSIDFGYIGYAVGMTLLLLLIFFPATLKITKENSQRGVVLQAVFRSNYALVGIPLATALFKEEGAIAATLLSAFIIPLFNTLAVIFLSVFGNNSGKIDAKKILIGIIKNPLIDSIALGCAVLGIRAVFTYLGINFRFSSITPVFSVLNQLSAVATPLALIVLGAQFEFSAIPTMKKQIIFSTVVRTALVPALALTAAYFMDCFSGAHFAAFTALFGTPVAVSSVPMAQEMGADTALAGQIVVWTTIMSAFSIFLISFILTLLGVFPTI